MNDTTTTTPTSSSLWDKQIQDVVPAIIYMISSSSDTQHSEEAYHTGKFELPNPAGKAGGACTSAFLQQQYETGNQQSWIQTLQSMKSVLSTMGYEQTPNLSCSRSFDMNSPMNIVPMKSGRRRALLIGINYIGYPNELTACHNDCMNIREYLINVHGFNESEILVLMDDIDNQYKKPTKENIENAMCLISMYSQPNDVVFVSFSGHGGNIKDINGDEDDGYDETLIPLDFVENGHILDDDIVNMLIKPMSQGVTMTILMDCCHSGTVCDLPYKFGANDHEFTREMGFNMTKMNKPERSHRGVMLPPGTASLAAAAAAAKKKKAAKEAAENNNNDDEEEDNEVVGPKRSENGQPILPIRKVANNNNNNNSNNNNQSNNNNNDNNNNDNDKPEQAKKNKKKDSTTTTTKNNNPDNTNNNSTNKTKKKKDDDKKDHNTNTTTKEEEDPSTNNKKKGWKNMFGLKKKS